MCFMASHLACFGDESVTRSPPNRTSLAGDEYRRAAAALQSQFQQLAVFVGAVPLMGALEAGKLDDHRKHRAPIALDHIELAAEREVASAELLHRGDDALAILGHLLAIDDFADIEYA